MLIQRFAAFISYNHADRRWAEWLHRSLESWRPPTGVAFSVAGATVPPAARNPLKPVFIDRAELSTSNDLAASVRDALQRSDALIVVCSPAAARSRWVNEEVLAFKALGHAKRVFCLVVAGEPATGECFPPAIRFVVGDDGAVTNLPAAEPLAADLRPGKDTRPDALNKLIAGLLDLSLDQLRQRDAVRRQKRMMAITAASVVGSVIFGLLSVTAFLGKREAEVQRANAERESLTARRTADFMKSLFAVSDPGEARGNSITAREVLDRGVQQISQQLTDTPLVRADLRTTLGEVYASLGLLSQGRELLQAATATPDKPPAMTARVLTALGELDYRRGDYDTALKSLDEARKLLATADVSDVEIRMRLLAALGDVYFRKDELDKAKDYFQQALAASVGLKDQHMREAAARATHGIAQVDLEKGDLDAAAKGFEEALAEQMAVSGELHPLVPEILNDLSYIEYSRQKPAAAIKYLRRVLVIEKRLLGDRHPTTAPTLNNLARNLLEQRQFDEARRLLEESIDIRRNQVVDTSEEMAFAYSNHALALMGQGNLAAAEPEFIKGLSAATVLEHRLEAPIMADLADLECRTGRVNQGLERLQRARPIMAARYPNDPWRVALVDNIRAGCLTRQSQYAAATTLIESSMPAILERWNPDSMYGYNSVQRATTLYEKTGDTTQMARYRSLLKR